jgi:hypothetical protein
LRVFVGGFTADKARSAKGAGAAGGDPRAAEDRAGASFWLGESHQLAVASSMRPPRRELADRRVVQSAWGWELVTVSATEVVQSTLTTDSLLHDRDEKFGSGRPPSTRKTL